MGVIPKLEARLELSSISDDDEALTRLHYILFGNNGSRSSRKRQIGLWRPGSSESDIKRPQIKREIVETLGTVLKEICVILGAEIGSSRSENEEIILRALTEKPGPVASSPSPPKQKPGLSIAPGSIKAEPTVGSPQIETEKKLPGRKKGGKNNPTYQAEYEAGTRRRPGRPRQIDEHRALVEFLRRNHPSVITEWEETEPWVKEMYDSGKEIPRIENRIEERSVSPERVPQSPKRVMDKQSVSPRRPQKTVTVFPVVPEIVKRGRGRPKKIPRGRPKKIEEVSKDIISPAVATEIRKKRGRPSKTIQIINQKVQSPVKRGRGRPRKTTAPVVVEPVVAKRGPGRPRKYF